MISSFAISVVTPALNPGTHMRRAVDVLNRQTLRDFEWVLVDDASDLEQKPFFDEAHKANFSVRHISLASRSGPAQARNVGVAAAQGRYVKFLDVDDALDPDHLGKLLQEAERAEEAQIIPFAPTRHDYVATGHGYDNHGYQTVGSAPMEQLIRVLTAPFLSHCGALFPRALLLSLGPYDTTLTTDEDGDLLVRVLLEGWAFRAVPSSVYIYRHSEGARVSDDGERGKLLSRRRVCDKLMAWYDQRDTPMPDNVREALATRLDAVAMRAWRHDRPLAKELLAAAAELSPNHQRSGSPAERLLRRLIGNGPALRAMALTRQARGRTVG